MIIYNLKETLLHTPLFRLHLKNRNKTYAYNKLSLERLNLSQRMGWDHHLKSETLRLHPLSAATCYLNFGKPTNRNLVMHLDEIAWLPNIKYPLPSFWSPFILKIFSFYWADIRRIGILWTASLNGLFIWFFLNAF